jgi:hypothetical protein
MDPSPSMTLLDAEELELIDFYVGETFRNGDGIRRYEQSYNPVFRWHCFELQGHVSYSAVG